MTDSNLPPAPPPPAGGYAQQPPMSPQDEKTWSTLTHVGGIFFSFVPALVVYLVAKDRGPFVRAHSATALNFQISMAIYFAALSILTVVLTLVTLGFWTFIAWLPFLALGVVIIVFSIIAAVRANKGEYYAYPLTIKFIK
jgi:uncharacterized protein